MTSCLRSLSALLLLTLVACGAKTSTPEQREHALDLIAGEALEAHVSYLAADALMGRESGETGYELAATYVAKQFAAMGLEPAGVDGWNQDVALRSYRIDPDSPRLVIHRGGEDEVLTYRDDFSMSADAVHESSSIRAGVVYAGFGVHAPALGYTDYDSVAVSGKIIAIFDGSPESIEGSERAHYASYRTKSLEAVSRGVVGIVFLRARDQERKSPWEKSKRRIGKGTSMAWVTNDGSTSGHHEGLHARTLLTVSTSESLFGPAPLSFADAEEAASNSEEASADLGLELTLSRRSTHGNTTSPNVIGLIRGTDRALCKEYVVYTAHLDHVGTVTDPNADTVDTINNGAYDNAMGVALMLETARAIALAPPKRSVLFLALTAEEKGLLGSDYFVHHPTVPADAIVANINLDMPLFLYPVADLVAFGSQHSSLQQIVEQSARDEGFVFSPDPLPKENLFVRSDQYSFVRAGIPAVYLMPGFTSSSNDLDGEALFLDHIKNHYHKPSDDLTRPVDWGSAQRFARAHTRIGFAIANDVDRPTWNEGDFFGARFSTGGN